MSQHSPASGLSTEVISEKLDALDKRLQDQRAFLNTFFSLISLLFGAFAILLTLAGYFQFNREVARIEDLKEQISAQLGLLEDTSQVSIATVEGTGGDPLVLSATILPERRNTIATLEYPDPKREFARVALGMRLRNSGSSVAQLTQVKFYVTAPLAIQSLVGSDRPDYEFETTEAISEDEYGRLIPPGSSIRIYYRYPIYKDGFGTKKTISEVACLSGDVPGFVEVHYGQDKIASKQVIFRIANAFSRFCER